jgi:hypothetical protein
MERRTSCLTVSRGLPHLAYAKPTGGIGKSNCVKTNNSDLHVTLSCFLQGQRKSWDRKNSASDFQHQVFTPGVLITKNEAFFEHLMRGLINNTN